MGIILQSTVCELRKVNIHPICKLLICLFYHKNRLVISSQEFWYNKMKSNFIQDEQKIVALAETQTSMPKPLK